MKGQLSPFKSTEKSSSAKVNPTKQKQSHQYHEISSLQEGKPASNMD